LVEIPDCTCDNPAAQWAAAIELVKESSKVFVESRDTKACGIACGIYLLNCSNSRFFELLKLTAPYSLLVRPCKEMAAAKSRQIQDLPPDLQKELKESEDTLRHHANLVESHKAVAKQATKRKLLVFQQAEFAVMLSLSANARRSRLNTAEPRRPQFTVTGLRSHEPTQGLVVLHGRPPRFQ
jgi:hypothetical protein